MELFLQIALGFPTVVFSMLLTVLLLYWVLAMLGMLGGDVLQVSTGEEAHSVELGDEAGLLMKWGLDGIPMMLILTAIALVGWLLSYFADYFLLRHLPFDLPRYLVGTVAVVLVFLLSVPLAGVVLHPLKPLFAKGAQVSSESLLGRTVVVRSAEVTLQLGQADLEDGGAGLILQVRADSGQFRRGDRVVLVEYLETQNAYRVIRDSEH